MAYSLLQCDSCGNADYSDENPMVEFRRPRPSDPRDVCCVLAGHMRCFKLTADSLSTDEHGGVATREQWNEWASKNPRYILG